MSAHCIKQDICIAGEDAGEEGNMVWQMQMVFQRSIQQGNDAASDDTHDEESGADLGKFTQACDGEREDGGPHEGVCQSEQGDEYDRDITLGHKGAEREKDTEDRRNAKTCLL